ncbi:plastocyanin/azurin family copper-binding protein [Loktanella sp. R86503]|uniref:cupredoxin domain-containing protein n=1 Tax=Loktanella sp. R86503 TaxID=3093847 RepID=UPI0036D90678
MRRILYAFAPLAVVAACAGSGSAPTGVAQQPAAQVVTMTADLKYSPAAVTVDAGQTVEFRNVSNFAQNVSTEADTPAELQVALMPTGAVPFNSGEIAPNESFRQTFSVPGTYRYFSEANVSEGMIGTVIVNP